jgi:predicted SprT family Zn-dependent metalloprotease
MSNIQILINNIEYLAKKLIATDFTYPNEYGDEITKSAEDIGYRFRWNYRSKSAFGRCKGREKIIELSQHLVSHNIENMEQIKDTILHEIAHALAGVRHGHDKYWQRVAIAIGCNGKRCYDSRTVNAGKTKYTLRCPNGHESAAHRRPKRSKSCGRCGNGVYDPMLKMEVIQNY